MKKKHPSKTQHMQPRSNLFSIFLLLLIILPLIVLYYAYWYYSHDLPDLTKITGYNPPLITEVYSSDGKLIGEFATQKRKLISYEETPKHVKDAFLAIEDKRFFQHKGVDFTRIVGALIKNIQEREIVQGASTITQQVTKNLILSPEKSITRKIKEAILAYRMENNLSKEEIFYIYLNHIYLADGTYGIEAASKNYFGKSARDINIAEAALLAGLPKRPEYFSPRKHLDRALERQRLVLKIMEEEKFITKGQRKEAEKYKIQILPKRNKTFEVAPYFVELVRQHLENMVGTKAFINGGFKIFTTLNVDQSLAAQWALRKGILDLESRRGREVVLKHLRNGADIKRFRKSHTIKNIEIGKTYKAVIIDQAKTNIAGVYSATAAIGKQEGGFIYAISSPLGTAANGFSFELSEKFAPLNGYDGINLLPIKLKVGDVIKLKVKNYKDD
ncbi:MAG: transglycosylase domain-containing protein, partial [Thermodesulfobacteriota bacterium]